MPIASRKMGPPKEGDPPEALALYRELHGVPETVDGYELARPETVPEGIWNDALAGEFADFCLKNNIPKASAKGMMEWWSTKEAERARRFTDGIEADGRSTEDTLRAEFGDRYEAEISGARRAYQLVGPDEDFDGTFELTKGGAAFVRHFAKLGHLIGEDVPVGLPGGQSGGGMNPNAAREELAKIHGDEKHAYHNKFDPAHDAAVARARQLTNIIYGFKDE